MHQVVINIRKIMYNAEVIILMDWREEKNDQQLEQSHYSSSQLTGWFADDAFLYRVFIMEEVLKAEFLLQFHDY